MLGPVTSRAEVATPCHAFLTSLTARFTVDTVYATAPTTVATVDTTATHAVIMPTGAPDGALLGLIKSAFKSLRGCINENIYMVASGLVDSSLNIRMRVSKEGINIS